MILDFLTFEFRVQDLLGLVNWGVAGVGWWYCGWAGSKCKHLTAGPFSELGPSVNTHSVAGLGPNVNIHNYLLSNSYSSF